MELLADVQGDRDWFDGLLQYINALKTTRVCPAGNPSLDVAQSRYCEPCGVYKARQPRFYNNAIFPGLLQSQAPSQ
jgi:hypothetical protein